MADLAERLALIIDARTDGAVSNIKRLALSEQEAADKAELLQARIADLNTRIARSSSGATAVQSVQLKKMTGEYQALTSTLGNVPAGVSKAEKALGKAGLGGLVPQGVLRAAGKVLPGLAAGAAAFGAFEFIKTGVENYTKLADEIRAVQYAAASSAPDASRLVAITNALGLDAQTAALGLFRLGKNIELQPQKLAVYGVAVARTKAGNTDLIGTLANVATAYQNTQDPAKKAAIVYEAFGRAGTSMLPILNQNAAKLKEIAAEAGKQGRLFSQADLDSAKEYEITMRELKDSLQGLGLVAARDVVPTLNKVANIATSVSDFGSRHKGLFSFVGDVAKEASGVAGFIPDLFGGGGSKAARAKAIQQQKDDQTAAQQAALEQAALGTLNPFAIQATGAAAVGTAKRILADAQATLTRALDTRRSAQASLVKLQAGTSGASSTDLEAARQRLIAAEANLRAAEYVGGDKRVASAKAELLSAQSRLNKLRGEGAGKTNDLANAEDRLRLSQKGVADAQHGVRAAQKGVNDATGFNAKEVAAQISAQVTDKGKLLTAELKLAGEGASSSLLGHLNTVNQQTPGTLVKFASTATLAQIRGLNSKLEQYAADTDTFSKVAGSPDQWAAAGRKSGAAWIDGFDQAALNKFAASQPNGFGASIAKPVTSKLGASLYGNVPGVSITINGGLHTDAKTGAQLTADLAKHARLRNLGAGSSRAQP